MRWVFLFLAACSAAPQPQNQPMVTATLPAHVEIDSDNDGAPDVCDHCPREPGVNRADHPFGRGCPWIDAFVGEYEDLWRMRARFRRGDAKVENDISDVAWEMNKRPADRFIVVGHASADEPDPDALAMQRAEAVATALQTAGVDRSRLELHSAGMTHPEYGEKPEASRRVVFDLFHDHARGRTWSEARREVDYVIPEDLPCR